MMLLISFPKMRGSFSLMEVLQLLTKEQLL